MNPLLESLGLEDVSPGTYSGRWHIESSGGTLESFSPIDGSRIGALELTSEKSYETVVTASLEAFAKWRMVPAPRRGEIVRQIGVALREQKETLADLITLECGKIKQEALGEVQEAIDIADFAVGLSRQLYGNAMHSERPRHRMYEQWHPLGPVGVITAFNFPLAVWAWNAMLAAVCGDVIIWKPSELTPLIAAAATKICARVTTANDMPAVFGLITGDGPSLGRRLAEDPRVPLISATGSCAMGRSVSAVVGGRLGRVLLELGGNNAIVVAKDADLELATRAIFFGAVGTAGQRCTSTRRVLAERSIADALLERLLKLYKQVRIGDPRDPATLMGPLITEKAVDGYAHGLQQMQQQGGKILCGGKLVPNLPSSLYVEPTIVLATKELPYLQTEIFAPILSIIAVDSVTDAIAQNNAVPQGLSSAIFTRSFQSSEEFLAHSGSDCGIANVNLGTSGAEIGGAFGGEKDTGGGREAGSDSWKSYMRRQTCTLNWSDELPLAQGITFGE